MFHAPKPVYGDMIFGLSLFFLAGFIIGFLTGFLICCKFGKMKIKIKTQYI